MLIYKISEIFQNFKVFMLFLCVLILENVSRFHGSRVNDNVKGAANISMTHSQLKILKESLSLFFLDTIILHSYTTLPHQLTNVILLNLNERTFVREKYLYLAYLYCNEKYTCLNFGGS